MRADVDLVARSQQVRPLDARTVDERAVGRLEVDERHVGAGKEDAGMGTRDARLRDHQIVRGRATDGDLSLLERQGAGRRAGLRDDDAEHRCPGA
jgi:hypothetical protein